MLPPTHVRDASLDSMGGYVTRPCRLPEAAAVTWKQPKA